MNPWNSGCETNMNGGERRYMQTLGRNAYIVCLFLYFPCLLTYCNLHDKWVKAYRRSFDEVDCGGGWEISWDWG
jgi:hypothetical protein